MVQVLGRDSAGAAHCVRQNGHRGCATHERSLGAALGDELGLLDAVCRGVFELLLVRLDVDLELADLSVLDLP